MVTTISDLIIPEIFAKYFSEQSVLRNSFVQSGVIQNSPALTALMRGGGVTGNMPFFKFLTGDSEVLSETNALTPGGNAAGKEVYAVLARGRAFGETDLAAAFSGADPIGAMAAQIGEYWTGEMSKALIATLTGLFTNASMVGLVSDITAAGTAATRTLNSATFVDAMQKLGDMSSKVVAIGVHSATAGVLFKEGITTTIRGASEYEVDYQTYLGKRLIVDDSLPVGADATAGQYTSYLFTEGSVLYGGNTAPKPVETDRDTLAGKDYLITRNHMVLHPRGASVDVSGIAGLTPSNAELAGDIWTRVGEVKNMGIVQVKHLNA
jgi:hypothetical protein